MPKAPERAKFYDSVRTSLFDGTLSQSQVDGMEFLFAEYESRPGFQARWFAYLLATAFHETAQTMQPIEEYGKGHGRPYGKKDPLTGEAYYGRGYVQLTWKANYEKMGRKLKVGLVNSPDLALDHKIAAQIIFTGMMDGDFTGVGLSTFFSRTRTDWVGARRIINGTDRAQLIAGYGKLFHAALTNKS